MLLAVHGVAITREAIAGHLQALGMGAALAVKVYHTLMPVAAGRGLFSDACAALPWHVGTHAVDE